MSAKILKFTPRADNRLYSQGQEIPVATVIPLVRETSSFKPPLITYTDYIKMTPESFKHDEENVLSKFSFTWDEQYKAMYSQIDDGEIVEKRGNAFFYLYVLPFNMYPCEYKVFKSFKDLVAFLENR